MDEHEALGAWPPPDAERVPLAGLYRRLAELGYDYGPAFQGLRGLWRRGEEELFAEVSLPEEQRALAGELALHPALLDSALHSLAIGMLDGAGSQLRLPFQWQGVEVRRKGADALRVKLFLRGEGGASLLAFDASGAIVATVQALLTRDVSSEQLSEQLAGSRPAHGDSLFGLQWIEIDSASAALSDGEPACTRT